MKIGKLFTSRRATIVVAATAALILGVGGYAVAASTSKAGTVVTRVSAVTNDTAAVYTGPTWQNVGSTAIYATSGSFLVATFSGESACYGAAGWCSVRILVDGVEADPVVGTDFSFNSTDNGTETSSSWESHSIQRTKALTTIGSHSVVAQSYATVATISHRLDDWTLTVEAVNP